ncbi:beta-ketoacyl-[acyl-carrier-protein] synthase II [Verrucomicrobia bacterium SCGC AG-212-E04]|nr:beta-ketoacyl-[acyl-carrier-protein] synthase II [Verrucomicrobia bacterium SCGC AG-212-E04]
MDRRVVITGIGVMTPIGDDLKTFWHNLSNGVSGIGLISLFDTTLYDCKIGGEVKNFEPIKYFNVPKDVKRADRYSQLLMAASKLAVLDAGLGTFETVDKDRFGCFLGSGIGGLKSIEDQHTNLVTKSPSRVSPFMIPMMIANMGSGLVAMEYGLRGPNMSIVTACASANNTLGEAWRTIKFGDADGFIAGGGEAAIAPLGLSGFGNMKALSMRNDDPQRASRPWDKDRDGFVLSEGAGVMILEELEHAKKRGARIYAELTGYGVSCDAYHMTSPTPDGSGAALAMNMALKHAKVNPEQVDYLNAHATSTGLGDIAETTAIKRAFGDYAKKGLAVSSTKSMTGHTLGAAGAVELAACLLAMQHGVMPPTINLDTPDPECDLDYVPKVAREKQIKVAMSNSFGFGGHNATLVVSEFAG